MHPKGANKKRDDQAMFSKEGPNLKSPALTNKPNVIPKIYKLKNNRSRGKPNSKIETPNKGAVKMIAGTNPINVLIRAVKIKAVTISFTCSFGFGGSVDRSRIPSSEATIINGLKIIERFFSNS